MEYTYHSKKDGFKICKTNDRRGCQFDIRNSQLNRNISNSFLSKVDQTGEKNNINASLFEIYHTENSSLINHQTYKITMLYSETEKGGSSKLDVEIFRLNPVKELIGGNYIYFSSAIKKEKTGRRYNVYSIKMIQNTHVFDSWFPVSCLDKYTIGDIVKKISFSKINHNITQQHRYVKNFLNKGWNKLIIEHPMHSLDTTNKELRGSNSITYNVNKMKFHVGKE